MSDIKRFQAVRALQRRLMDECKLTPQDMVCIPQVAISLLLEGQACIVVREVQPGTTTVWLQKPFTISSQEGAP